MHAAHKLNKGLLFIVVSLLMMASSLFLYQGRSHAIAGWTTLHSSAAGLTLVCKKYVNSGYGPLWQVKAATLSNAPSGSLTYTYIDFVGSIQRPGTGHVASIYSGAVTNGQWDTGQAYASQILGDYLYYETMHIYSQNGYHSGIPSGTRQFSSIVNCQ